MPIYCRHSSVTDEWNDGRLQPSPLADEADSEVWFPLPLDGEREQVWEALNARTIDADLVELRGVPALAHGIGFGDTVSVIRSGEGSLVADGIRERSSYATFRIWLGDDVDPTITWKTFAEGFARLGCLVDVYSPRLVALACPDGEVDTVRAALEAQSEASGLDWEQSA